MPDRPKGAVIVGNFVWWDWDLPSDRIAVRGGATCILGFCQEQLPSTGAAWYLATHPDDLVRVRDAMQACLEGNAEEWSCEHRLAGPDKKWYWVLNAGQTVAYGKDRRPTRMIGFTQDIADRREAEIDLYRDSLILANVKESIIRTNLDGMVTYWNAGATELYGWAAEEMLGRPFYSRMANEEMRVRARARMRAAIAAGEYRSEREDFRKDGTRIFVESRVFAVRDGTGAVVGVIGMGHDITARVEAERHRRVLEHQLLQAQKMETIGTLAGGVAHEFNNLIAAIIGNTELAMMQNPDDQRFRGYHESVLNASHRARDLVKRLLTFSRAHEPERGPVRLGQMVAEAAQLIRATLPSTVELELDLAPELPATMGDANQLHQVLMNLAANAAYAMREHGGKLTLRARVADLPHGYHNAFVALTPGVYQVLEVADTGQGMDEATLKRIFDPFFTTKPVGEGSGLGLSIVHGIMGRHGGSVDVASVPGAGSTFTLYLPYVAAPAAVAAPAPRPSAAIPRGHGEQVVVIDDEEGVGFVTEGALRSLGYRPRRYSSAETFLAEFSSAPFAVDLIVTDQTMPRLTGLQLAQRLRAAGQTIPIAIVSGYSRDLQGSDLAAVGRVTVLEKPFDLKQLAVVVHDLLNPSAPA